MTIPFSQLAEPLRIAIVEKQDIRDFVNFSGCSRDSYETAKKINTRFVFDIPRVMWVKGRNKGFKFLIDVSGAHDFKVKTLLVSCVLNSPVSLAVQEFQSQGKSDEFEFLMKFLRITNSSFRRLSFFSFENIEVSAVQFNTLLETSKVREINQRTSVISPEYYGVPAMAQIEYFTSSCPSLGDDHILSLRIPQMSIKDGTATNSGINSLIKDWLSKKREIWFISIQSKQTKFVQSAMLDGIQHSVVKCKTVPRENRTAYMATEAFIIKRGDGEGIAVRNVLRCTDIGNLKNEEVRAILE